MNSYFINRGISSGKISFNMGLTSEQPPAKFSNLEGLSIVFDYETPPNLHRRLVDPDTPPILSLGMYPFETLDVSKGGGMLVDFSVIEASSPVVDWSLQIVQHNKDDSFYIVRQVTGMGAVYRQIFWNGRRQYFGEVLPLGRYTIILRAKDIDGREKVVRRRVNLTGETVKAPKLSAAASSSAKGPDYKAARLWKQPAAVRKAGAAEAAGDENIAEDEMQYNPPSLPTGYGAAGNTGYNSVNMPFPAQVPSEYDY